MRNVIVNCKYIVSIFSVVLLVFGMQSIGYSQTLVASSEQPLTGTTLHKSVVTLTLSGGTYVRFSWDIADALTVSGIPGVTIGQFNHFGQVGPAWFGVERVSDTQIAVELGFDGNIATDATLTFTVRAGAIANYNGPTLTAEVPVTAQGATATQDHLQGPWLWMIAPGGNINVDNLSAASDGLITEENIAEYGVSEGEHFNALQWTSGRLLPTTVCGIFLCSSDNVINVVRKIGLTNSNQLTQYSAYALINIHSPRAQNGVLMGVGSDDSVKVWLNGAVVYLNNTTRRTTGIQNRFRVNLNAGNNLLLVKVCNSGSWFGGSWFGNDDWGMFFKIYLNPQDYTISLPRTIPQELESQSDLVVEAVQAEPATVAPGEEFRLYATLRNKGTGASTATTLRYYRSTDNVISTEDTQLSRANRDPLAANATIRRYLNVTAPTTPGTYYYGVCVDSFTNESDTTNNCSIAVSVTVTATTVVSEDVNADGVVDVQDLVYVAQQYGQTGTTAADVNGDGVVNIDDLILVAAALDADAAAAPSLYSDALEQFSVSDVQLWLSQARQRDVADPSVRKGILFLEQLLASIVPKETVLLANYPNPFNPETWIPYQLAKPAEVTITIYAINGQAVRTLALGHQVAGMYQSRSRAAYWDGKNELGEAVASGLYFYTLTAGDFSATRKMLIRK